jgi:multidrug efflux pump subunit AcrA (membrane-fusion protein)
MMRLWKIVIGILLVGFALYVIVGEQLAGASADAVVNVRLTTLRAPIAGRVGMPLRSVGIRVRQGDALGMLKDPLVDTKRLADLRNEQARTVAESRRLKTALAAVQEAIGRLRARSSSYKAERVRQLEAQVSASQALSHAARSELELSRKVLERSKRLRGIESTATLEQAQSRAEVAQRALESAIAATAVNQVSLNAARKGTFLGDGSNDAPYSEQRIEDLLLRKREIEAELSAHGEIAKSMEARITVERLLVNRQMAAPITANVNGFVWTLEVADGEIVQRGQELVRLVDCDSMLVTLSVSESVYNSLSAGARATFRMTGTSRVFEGTIIRLAGAGAEDVYSNLAIAPSERHLQRYDVALSVPALATDPELRCLVGRTGRVFFDRSPLNEILELWR